MRAPSFATHAAIVVALASVLALTSACPAHVVLDRPPPPTAAEVTRRDYFDSHRALPLERGQLQQSTRLGETRPTFHVKSLVLANDIVVERVDDLAPLVADDSEAGRAIAESVEARGRADVVSGVGYGVAGLGAAAAATLVALAITTSENDQADRTALPVELYVAGGAVAVALAGVGVAAWGSTIRDDERDAATRAFRAFDAGLWQKLALPGEPPPRKE